jgi:hypothetical protein
LASLPPRPPECGASWPCCHPARQSAGPLGQVASPPARVRGLLATMPARPPERRASWPRIEYLSPTGRSHYFDRTALMETFGLGRCGVRDQRPAAVEKNAAGEACGGRTPTTNAAILSSRTGRQFRGMGMGSRRDKAEIDECPMNVPFLPRSGFTSIIVGDSLAGKSFLCNPFRVSFLGHSGFPGCAPRPWALLWNRFAVRARAVALGIKRA